MAAFGTRQAVGFVQWRARREAQAAMARASGQVFRGFVQINMIHLR